MFMIKLCQKSKRKNYLALAYRELHQKLREILKKLKLNKYYEHVPHIINRIGGIQAPTMRRETEENFVLRVQQIQIPFIRHVSDRDRKNFLSIFLCSPQICRTCRIR